MKMKVPTISIGDATVVIYIPHPNPAASNAIGGVGVNAKDGNARRKVIGRAVGQSLLERRHDVQSVKVRGGEERPG